MPLSQKPRSRRLRGNSSLSYTGRVSSGVSGTKPWTTLGSVIAGSSADVHLSLAAATRWMVRLVLVSLIGWGCAGGAGPELLADDTPVADTLEVGEEIYRQHCLSCHGEQGEGSEDYYPYALVGDRSIAELTELIEETMPEEDPDACVGKEAASVAAYIHHAFYSPLAQARNRPARIELSRLTVGQYRNVIADLVRPIGERNPPTVDWDGERGLSAEYFNDRRLRNDKRVIERVDPLVNFDFEDASPDADQIESEIFAMRWRGTLVPPDTGVYELVVKTENAARLWVNDDERPLVDAWVRSGDDREFRGSLFLLGGRPYSLRLEYFKMKEPSASISLCWRPPHGTEVPIPSRHLLPERGPTWLIVEPPFPPDDRSMGYERGTSISRAWIEATTEGALEVAAYVVNRLPQLAGYRDRDDQQAEKVRRYCDWFVERALGRPLTEEEQEVFLERQFRDAPDLETAVKRVVILTLKSPRFLYRDMEPGSKDPHVVAQRMALGLWDSLPDEALWRAAAEGNLATREEVVEQLRRMMSDFRTRSKLREFLHAWLEINRSVELSKDRTRYPDFDDDLLFDLRTSLDLFLEEVAWDDGSSFRDLLLADHVYLNGRLAQFYGAELPDDSPFTRVPLDAHLRSGALTHPYLMALLADHGASSPIHRGVFLVRHLLGRMLRPPPDAVAPLSPDLHPDLTTRQRVDLQTSPTSCQTCHRIINPLGYGLEHFDAVGRYREQEKELAIDAQGWYRTPQDEVIHFDGARQLAQFLADSPEVHAAFATQMFHHFVKQPVRAYGDERAEMFRERFEQSDFQIQELLVEVIATASLAELMEEPDSTDLSEKR